MFHSPPKDFIYTAYKLVLDFEDDNGTNPQRLGTGFMLQDKYDEPLLVTNRHVWEADYPSSNPKYKNLRLKKAMIYGRRADDSVYEIEVFTTSKKFVHADKNNDVILVRPEINDPQNNRLHWRFGVEHLATKDDYQKIQASDLLFYSGFPEQHDKFGDRPILRHGYICSDPRYDYSWDSAHRGQVVAYEGFSSAGSSGAPVFSPHKGFKGISDSRSEKLIGVNAGHVEEYDHRGHSGVSYFFKSTVIVEIMALNNLL